MEKARLRIRACVEPYDLSAGSMVDGGSGRKNTVHAKHNDSRYGLGGLLKYYYQEAA